jgi:hypothetical protein
VVKFPLDIEKSQRVQVNQRNAPFNARIGEWTMTEPSQEPRERRLSGSFSLPQATHDFIDAVARERFQYNRSAALEHYIELGRAAEAEGWHPQDAAPKGRVRP